MVDDVLSMHRGMVPPRYIPPSSTLAHAYADARGLEAEPAQAVVRSIVTDSVLVDLTRVLLTRYFIMVCVRCRVARQVARSPPSNEYAKPYM